MGDHRDVQSADAIVTDAGASAFAIVRPKKSAIGARPLTAEIAGHLLLLARIRLAVFHHGSSAASQPIPFHENIDKLTV